MNQKETNYQEMVSRVLGHFELHTEAWHDEAPVAKRVERLQSIYKLLCEQSDNQRRSGSDLFSAKDAALDQGAGIAALLATRLRSFASHTGDPLLLKQMEITDSELRYGAQDLRIGYMNDILEKAQEFSAPAAAFKVRATDINALRDALGRAGALRKQANDQRSHGTAATGRIPSLIEQARLELLGLDDDVQGMVEDEPFIDAYFVARRITDRRATRSGSEQPGGAA